jgi:hypothetical protein
MNILPMTPSDAHNLPRTEPEFRAERLGYALRSLAADLVDERHKVAELRREVAELRARLESLKEPHPGANEVARGEVMSSHNPPRVDHCDGH